MELQREVKEIKILGRDIQVKKKKRKKKGSQA